MREGTLIYWTINESITTAKALSDLGFADYVPRNDYKSAMIKALHAHVRGNSKLYRAFNDTSASISFGVFVQNVGQEDLNMAKEVIIQVDKKSGSCSFKVPVGVTFDESKIMSDFRVSKSTLNANQLRSAILKYVRENHAISMRPSGGIYFIDDRFEESLEKLRTIFRAFPSTTQLFEIEMGSDQKSLAALEDATHGVLFAEIEKLVEDVNENFRKGTLTKKMLQNRREDSEKLLAEIKIHEANLRTRAKEIIEQVSKVSHILEVKLKVAENTIMDEGEFAGLLRLM